MKTVKTGLLVLITFIGLVSAEAQSTNFFFGVKGGLGIPNLTAGSKSTPLSEGYSSRLGFYGGLVAEDQTGDHFALRGELNYSSQGGKRKGMQALPLSAQLAQLWQMLPGFGITPDPYMYANIKSEAILDYLEIPVMAKYSFNLSTKIKFYLEAGPYLGVLVHAKNVTSGSSSIYVDKAGTIPVDAILEEASQSPIGAQSFDHTENITSDVHRFNLGGEGAAGFDLLAGRGKLFLEGGGNFGFIPIQKDDANGTNHTGAGTVTFGYLLSLK